MPDSSFRNYYISRVKPFWRSIKGKIFLVFFFTFLSVCALTILNYWSMNILKNRLLLLEGYEDVLNNILEVRRFEKNYLFYRDTASLDESIEYLDSIDATLREIGGDIQEVAGQKEYARLVQTFNEYHAIINAAQRGMSQRQENLRELGKALVDSADALLTSKRERIHQAIVRTSLIPFTLLAAFGLLMILIIQIISFGLLNPLDIVRTTTERVARGDFRPIPLEDGQLMEISAFIGAFNRMANELEANQEDLLQARKIAALGTFTAGIAHELNNPINNISLSAETLAELYEDVLEEDGREMVRDIALQAERAGEIVKNLLDFSRTERPAFNSLAVSAIVHSTVNLLKNQLMLAGIRLKTIMPEDLPQVCGNIGNLQQVFMNLLLNAIQAMPDGGEIAVVAGTSQNMVRIDIEDQGSGIRKEVLQHIFEPFFTTKEVGKGTGLGLAVVYSIVQRHGGRVEVRSEVGKGAVFSVFLPISGGKPCQKYA